MLFKFLKFFEFLFCYLWRELDVFLEEYLIRRFFNNVKKCGCVGIILKFRCGKGFRVD